MMDFLEKKPVKRNFLVSLIFLAGLSMLLPSLVLGSNPEQATDWALEFNGSGDSGDYIEIENNENLNAELGAITLSFWIYPRYENDFVAILDATDGTWSGDGYSFYLRPHESTGEQFAWAVNGDSLRAGTVIMYEWQHVVATFDGNDMMIYVDGSEEGSTSAPSSTVQTSENMMIGRMSDRDWQYSHLIGEFQIYEGALTESEIWELYQNPGYVSDEEPIVGHWGFAEGSGDTAYDLAEGAGPHHGTIHGAQWKEWIKDIETTEDVDLMEVNLKAPDDSESGWLKTEGSAGDWIHDGYTYCPVEGSYDGKGRIEEGEWEQDGWSEDIYNVDYNAFKEWCEDCAADKHGYGFNWIEENYFEDTAYPSDDQPQCCGTNDDEIWETEGGSACVYGNVVPEGETSTETDRRYLNDGGILNFCSKYDEEDYPEWDYDTYGSEYKECEMLEGYYCGTGQNAGEWRAFEESGCQLVRRGRGELIRGGRITIN